MKSVVTIKGKPVIEVYESFDGSYWFAMEKAWKQNSLIGRKVYKNDQIFFGYVLSPELFDPSALRLAGP